jgi:hypothetical protein
LPSLVKRVFEEGQPGLTVNAQQVVAGGQNIFKHSTCYYSQTILKQSTFTDEEIGARIAKMESFLKMKEPPEEYAHFFKVVRPRRRLPFPNIHNFIEGGIKRHRKLLAKNPRTKWDYVVL